MVSERPGAIAIVYRRARGIILSQANMSLFESGAMLLELDMRKHAPLADCPLDITARKLKIPGLIAAGVACFLSMRV